MEDGLNMASHLAVGKLPPELLQNLLQDAPIDDPKVILGPGIGRDCAVVEAGDGLQVYTSDPITFTIENIGWYCVQICANDIATTGATPRWFLVTYLLPEKTATPELIEKISAQVHQACRALGIVVLGGHTEITAGLDRPILVGSLVGEVSREDLVLPSGARPGDRILLTKGVPIETTAILSRDFPERLHQGMSEEEMQTARNYLHDPGIGVTKDARIACQAGTVHAMHDPTEGGVATALWEMAEACGLSLIIEPSEISVPPLSRRLCEIFGINPFTSIASGALLLVVPSHEATVISRALREEEIGCSEIGRVEDGPAGVWYSDEFGRREFPHPSRDDIAKVYENT